VVKSSRFKVVWDILAFEQFKEILLYLEEQSDQAPKIVKKGILDRIKIIKQNPLTCESDKLRSPVSEDFRACVVFSYRMSYQIDFPSKQIRILRVRHTSREPLGY
jgi:plasmid stabilization system protein ParE